MKKDIDTDEGNIVRPARFMEAPKAPPLPVFSQQIRKFICDICDEDYKLIDAQTASRHFEALLDSVMCDLGYTTSDERQNPDMWALANDDQKLKAAMKLIEWHRDTALNVPDTPSPDDAEELAHRLAPTMGYIYVLDNPNYDAASQPYASMSPHFRKRLRDLSNDFVEYVDMLPEGMELPKDTFFNGMNHPHKNIDHGYEEQVFEEIIYKALLKLGYERPIAKEEERTEVIWENTHPGSNNNLNYNDEDYIDPDWSDVYRDHMLMEDLLDFVTDYFRREKTVADEMFAPSSTHTPALIKAAQKLQMPKLTIEEIMTPGGNAVHTSGAKVIPLHLASNTPAKS